MSRLYLWLLICSFVLSPSCSDRHDEVSPRLGELGRVKFTGGGGCNDSTTLALGARAELGLDPQSGELPADLRVSSTQPEVIATERGSANDRIVLVAGRLGDVRVELHDGEELYDRLGFSVEQARSVELAAADKVLQGGTFTLEVKEVFGACGRDCPLLGTDFIEFDAEPMGALSLLKDEDRVASFATGAPQQLVLRGRDVGSDHLLFSQPVEIVPVDEALSLDASIVVMPPDDDAREPAALPAQMPLQSLFTIDVVALTADGPVPIAGEDLDWDLSVSAGRVGTLGDARTPRGPIFEALDVGEATLQLSVELLDLRQPFVVRIE